MKILVVNYHYFEHGGPDRYLFNIKRSFETSRHTVIPFSFNYKETIPSEYSRYFVTPIGGPESPYIGTHDALGLAARAKMAIKMFVNREASQNFRKIISDTKPDLVYFLYLSYTFLPNLIRIAKQEYKLPVIYRISDFHMLCGSYTFSRGERVCTECLHGGFRIITNRCMHNSLAGSALRFLQMKYVKLRHWYSDVDYFVCPSAIMKEYLSTYTNIPLEKLIHIPTFAKDLMPKPTQSVSGRRPYVLFSGNITKAKGCRFLIRSFNRVPNPSFDLKLAGLAGDEFRLELLSELDEPHLRRVEFLGHLNQEALTQQLKASLYFVFPALWYENMPNSVLEAMSAAKAILATNIGSLPELVTDGINGRLVSPNDEEELANGLVSMATDPQLPELGANSRRRFLERHTETVHMAALYSLMGDAINMH